MIPPPPPEPVLVVLYARISTVSPPKQDSLRTIEVPLVPTNSLSVKRTPFI